MLHVDIPNRGEIEELIRVRGSARVSLYLPTKPVTPHAEADRIVLKNLTGEAVRQLADHDKREVRAIEELLFDLIDDDRFWEFGQQRGRFCHVRKSSHVPPPKPLAADCRGKRQVPHQRCGGAVMIGAKSRWTSRARSYFLSKLS